jgi:hypothetical protein
MNEGRATFSTVQAHPRRTLARFAQRKKALQKQATNKCLRHTRQDFRAAAVNADADLAGIAVPSDMIDMNTKETARRSKQDGQPRLSHYRENPSPK